MATIRTVSLFLLVFCSILTASEAQRKPNIVFILTDDQDTVLGGLEPLVKTKQLLGEQGMTFENMFVNTPLCCPSRASILTGQHVHNSMVQNNSLSGNCSSPLWQQYKERTEAFPPYIQRNGYRTFFAGKYLNQYGTKRAGGVQHIPAGWDEWHGLVGNSVYYNYTLSVNGRAERHGHNYEEDYLTDLIKRRAVQFLKNQSKDDPFFMMLSTPSAHHPFTPAPQYKTQFSDRMAPRSASFNTHAADKHWLLRQPPHPMKQSSIDYSDYSFRNRWRTLLSVDDLVQDVIGQLQSRDLLNHTYIVFASDNGFHMGQFSMPIDKRHLYEFDIRVPLIIRGPGIPPNTVSKHPVMNIDLAPTFLDLIGSPILPTMDGLSLKPILFNTTAKWRKHMLIEHSGEAKDYEKWCPAKSGRGVAICFPDCICQDSANNTYTCVRGLHQNNNYIYCEFQDDVDFREFYDLMSDPDQLQNDYQHLDPGLADMLRHLLARLRRCAGASCRAAGSIDMPTVMARVHDNTPNTVVVT